MANNFIELPLGYRRLYSGPLDVSTVMTSAVRTTNFGGGSHYVGQVVYDTDLQTLYVLTSSEAGKAWTAIGGTEAQTSSDTALNTLSTNLMGEFNKSLSSFDTIAELASAADKFTSSKFLSASNAVLDSGTLKLSTDTSIVGLDEKTIIDSGRNVYATNLYIGETGTIADSYKIESSGAATFNSLVVSTHYGITTEGVIQGTKLDLKASGGGSSSYFVGTNGSGTNIGDAKLASLTADSLYLGNTNTGYRIENSGDAYVKDLSASGNLTVTGNLSVLGETTYLDTNVVVLSTTLVSLSSDTETTLRLNQVGNSNILDLQNNGVNVLTVDKDGQLSASATATFAGDAFVKGDFEVGTGSPAMLYVDTNGVAVGTENPETGYKLTVDGTAYFSNSATFNNFVDIDKSHTQFDGGISDQGVVTMGRRAVNLETMWYFVSTLNGGSF